eukprot:Blabericola_migrator_1__5066@NODE_2623_length_2523_cov_85_302524_g1644_i0_p5_GENE_NODE_2623_length_2523_cov_85_302524_g1644_i0NODE_2623_length_2523_cov_85_302524_g1644_i0_p5_ORF_typecomplete_len105_score19_43_NODE_2623_length_2523_cov_85_302524_g1644_i011401454
MFVPAKTLLRFHEVPIECEFRRSQSTALLKDIGRDAPLKHTASKESPEAVPGGKKVAPIKKKTASKGKLAEEPMAVKKANKRRADYIAPKNLKALKHLSSVSTS